jgi:hypothetical protein
MLGDEIMLYGVGQWFGKLGKWKMIMESENVDKVIEVYNKLKVRNPNLIYGTFKNGIYNPKIK